MSIRTFQYKLCDIPPDMNTIAGLIGNYTMESLPGLYSQIINSEMKTLSYSTNIRGGYIIFEDFLLDQTKNTITINKVRFKPGIQVFKQLKNAEKLAFYICTAGEDITKRYKSLFSQGLYLEAYICDLLGTIILENVISMVYKDLKEKYANEGLKVTNRFGPGYCDWKIEEQHKLFSIFPKGFCKVTLTENAMMRPLKSISGIIGIGKSVKFNKISCQKCNIKNCPYTNMHIA